MDNTSISIIGENFSKGSSNQFISGGERTKAGGSTQLFQSQRPQSSPNVNHKWGCKYSEYSFVHHWYSHPKDIESWEVAPQDRRRIFPSLVVSSQSQPFTPWNLPPSAQLVQNIFSSKIKTIKNTVTLVYPPPLYGCWTMVFFRISLKRILSEGRQKAGIPFII